MPEKNLTQSFEIPWHFMVSSRINRWSWLRRSGGCDEGWFTSKPNKLRRQFSSLSSRADARNDNIPGRCGEALHGVMSKSPALEPLVSDRETESRLGRRSLKLSDSVGGPPMNEALVKLGRWSSSNGDSDSTSSSELSSALFLRFLLIVGVFSLTLSSLTFDGVFVNGSLSPSDSGRRRTPQLKLSVDSPSIDSLSYSKKSKSLNTPKSGWPSSRFDPPLRSCCAPDVSSVLDADDWRSNKSEDWLKMTCKRGEKKINRNFIYVRKWQIENGFNNKFKRNSGSEEKVLFFFSILNIH